MTGLTLKSTKATVKTLVRACLALLAAALGAGSARADPAEPAFEVGGGIGFAALGSYDLGEGLGRQGGGDDLGPGTLGVFLAADARVSSALRLGLEAGIAIGGLVGTEERYFGSESDVGSTATVWIRSRLGWSAIDRGWLRARVGGAAGVERMSEATGGSTVRVDSIVAGPWLALLIGRGLVAEVHADVHLPYRGRIGDDTGDPDGVFGSAGIRLGYLFGID